MPGGVTGGAVTFVAAAAIAAGALAVPAGVAHAADSGNVVYPQPSQSATDTTQWGPAYDVAGTDTGVVPADFADAL
ncbi:hypothetical protein ABH931_002050 [Streptacidiphilus sp. MAP12-33]|uniref:hypothetical protein n=1 Tax=Streptacidiphilus sp. MAP12-33 TaxID=3156266 RepID=UPI003515143F